MATEEEKSERLSRTLSDPDLLRRQREEHNAIKLDHPNRDTAPRSARDVLEGTSSRMGMRGGPAEGSTKMTKKPSWGRKSARGLLFRSGGPPKTHDGESPTPPGTLENRDRDMANTTTMGDSVEEDGRLQRIKSEGM